MTINGQKVIGDVFAYEGCHKIYICETQSDQDNMLGWGYEIYPISDLESTFLSSCSLRFISNAALNKSYVPQFKMAVFAS